MKRLFATLALAGSLLLPAYAGSSATPDYSDLWWNEAESGWGAHVTQQEEVIFLVLFVYDAGRQPRFLVASDMRHSSAGGADVYEGALYSTSGPPFAGAFDPSTVAIRAVGTATLRFDSPTAARVVYTVDGVTVTKSISRQTWSPPDLTGEYRGGIFARATACFNGLPTIAYPGTFTISQSGDAVTIDTRFDPGFAALGTCRMAGRVTAHGSLASITQGTYSCEFFDEPNTASGTFEIVGVRAGESGIGGRYLGREGPSCVHSGHFGGFRRGYPEPPPQPGPEEP